MEFLMGRALRDREDVRLDVEGLELPTFDGRTKLIPATGAAAILDGKQTFLREDRVEDQRTVMGLGIPLTFALGVLGVDDLRLMADRDADRDAVTFTSTEASMVYLNERTPSEPEADSYALRGADLDWRQGMVPGLKVTSLHQGLTKHTALVRWAPETRFNPHTHVGGEEILVLEGVFRDEHGSYPAGTWIRSPHMSNHRPFTGPEGATILVKVGHLDVA